MLSAPTSVGSWFTKKLVDFTAESNNISKKSKYGDCVVCCHPANHFCFQTKVAICSKECFRRYQQEFMKDHIQQKKRQQRKQLTQSTVGQSSIDKKREQKRKIKQSTNSTPICQKKNQKLKKITTKSVLKTNERKKKFK